MKAEIKWLKNTEHKNIPRIGEKYYPIIRLDNCDKPLNWSVVVENIEFLDDFITISEICFLMDTAPHSLLVEKTKFFLYEGHNLIAQGKII